MAFLEDQLVVKKSTIPGAGKGLFTKKAIKKGTRIVEYQGEVLTWAEVEEMADDRNGYVFYFNSKYVLDAWNYFKAFARYCNDAKGLTRVEGVKNNCEYIIHKKRCYIDAYTDIPAGGELLVGYGAEYWQAIRYNIRLFAARAKRKAAKKASKKIKELHNRAAKRLEHKH